MTNNLNVKAPKLATINKKPTGYFFELSIVILLTLTLFAGLTIPHLQHGVSFIFPVPLAVFIIRHKVKDGIFPAILMIIMGALITHFLPVGAGSWVRGFLIMLTAMTIGFLHGALHKTKLSHRNEILIVMAAELALSIVCVVVFYLLRDPVFAFDIEFPHYYASFQRLFNIKADSVYAQNVGIIFQNMVIPYTFALAITEVLFTHVLIHLTIKYVFETTDERPFTGLAFSIHASGGVLYLVGLVGCFASFIILRNPVDPTLMNIIIALFIMVFTAMIFFILQGVLLMIYVMRIKYNREQSLGIFILALTFAVFFSVLGALNTIFHWSDKLSAKETNIVRVRD